MRLLLVFLLLPLLMGASDYQTQDAEKNPSFVQLVELAEQGEEAEAQYSLGLMYFQGKDVAQDYAKAREWFEKAAQQGHVKAQYNLGLMYDHGKGGAQDYAKAREWYEKAAQQGLAKAQYNLGVMYDEGIGGPQDYAKAREMYGKAVQIGDSQSELLLHLIQDRETGTQQSEINSVIRQPFHETEKSQKPGVLHGPDWLLSKNKDYYAMQVIAVSSRRQIKRFADRYIHQTDWAYYAKQKDKKKIYVLIRCCLKNKIEGRKAIKDLPAELKSINPFLIKLDKIQKAIKDRDNMN